MKTKLSKVLLSIGIIILSINFSFASNIQSITFTQLPINAQEFLKTHFQTTNVSTILVEKHIFGNEYNVVLKDGTEIEFNKKGEWTDIDAKNKAVPSSLVPAQINDYISHHMDASVYVEQFKRNKRSYELELSNGLELKFNSKFKLMEMDH